MAASSLPPRVRSIDSVTSATYQVTSHLPIAHVVVLLHRLDHHTAMQAEALGLHFPVAQV